MTQRRLATFALVMSGVLGAALGGLIAVAPATVHAVCDGDGTSDDFQTLFSVSPPPSDQLLLEGTAPFKVTFSFSRVTDTNRMIDETECDSTTDRNPIVNGRFTFQK